MLGGTELFHRYCGEILRMALRLETNIEFFISNYFVSPQSRKTFLFEDLVVSKLSFDRKINIFEKICKKEKINEVELQKILKAMKFVRDIRNKVAHHDALIRHPEDGISLIPRRSKWRRKNETKINHELVMKVQENMLYAIRGIVKIHKMLYFSGTKDENGG